MTIINIVLLVLYFASCRGMLEYVRTRYKEAGWTFDRTDTVLHSLMSITWPVVLGFALVIRGFRK